MLVSKVACIATVSYKHLFHVPEKQHILYVFISTPTYLTVHLSYKTMTRLSDPVGRDHEISHTIACRLANTQNQYTNKTQTRS